MNTEKIKAEHLFTLDMRLGQEDIVYSMQLSPDDRSLLCDTLLTTLKRGYEQALFVIWDLENGEEWGRFYSDGGVCYTIDGTHAMVYGDINAPQAIVVYSLETGSVVHTLIRSQTQHHTKTVFADIAAGSLVAAVYHVTHPQDKLILGLWRFRGKEGSYREVDLSRYGNFSAVEAYVTFNDEYVIFSGRTETQLSGHEPKNIGMIIHAGTGQVIYYFECRSWTDDTSLSTDRRLFAFLDKNSEHLMLWDAQSPLTVRLLTQITRDKVTYTKNGYLNNDFYFSNANRFIKTQNDNNDYYWDMATGECSFALSKDVIHRLSRNGRILTKQLIGDDVIHMIDTTTYDKIRQLRGPRPHECENCYHLNAVIGNLLIFSGQNEIVLWDSYEDVECLSLPGQGWELSKDNKLLIIKNQDKLDVFKLSHL